MLYKKFFYFVIFAFISINIYSNVYNDQIVKPGIKTVEPVFCFNYQLYNPHNLWVNFADTDNSNSSLISRNLKISGIILTAVSSIGVIGGIVICALAGLDYYLFLYGDRSKTNVYLVASERFFYAGVPTLTISLSIMCAGIILMVLGFNYEKITSRLSRLQSKLKILDVSYSPINNIWALSTRIKLK